MDKELNIYKSISRYNKADKTRVLKLHYDPNSVGIGEHIRLIDNTIKLPYALPIFSFGLRCDGIKTLTGKIISPSKLEKSLLSIITRTKFDGYTVSRGEFEFNFEMFDTATIQNLILYITENKFKRISYTWLVPLQELLFNKIDSTKKKKKSSGLKYSVADNDPFMVETKKRITRLTKPAYTKSASIPMPENSGIWISTADSTTGGILATSAYNDMISSIAAKYE